VGKARGKRTEETTPSEGDCPHKKSGSQKKRGTRVKRSKGKPGKVDFKGDRK